MLICTTLQEHLGFSAGSDGKETACNAGDPGSIPGSGRSPGLATHSIILAWRISWTEKPGGLQPMGPQRGGCNWAANIAHFKGAQHTGEHGLKERFPKCVSRQAAFLTGHKCKFWSPYPQIDWCWNSACGAPRTSATSPPRWFQYAPKFKNRFTFGFASL